MVSIEDLADVILSMKLLMRMRKTKKMKMSKMKEMKASQAGLLWHQCANLQSLGIREEKRGEEDQ